MRYPGALWRPQAGATTYTGGPPRLVLHTTEGRSLEAAEAAYRSKGIAPHFTVCVATRRWAQHIDTAAAASAMANLPGGVQTNRRGARQIEIVGFAAHTQDMSDDDLRWLGGIIHTICAREGIDPRRHPAFVGTEAGTIATATAPQRMSKAEWESFNGVCGHQHVPENHHWDPGRFPYDRMLALLAKKEDPLMALTGEEQARLVRRVDALYDRLGRVEVRDSLPADQRSVVERRVSAIYLALPELMRGQDDVDEAAIAAAVLAGLGDVVLSDEQVNTIIDAMPAAVKTALREGTD